MIRGGLVTRDFLVEGIVETDAWKALTLEAVERVRQRLDENFSALRKSRKPTEADTEKQFIWPTLEALDWTATMIQQNLTVKGRQDVPDGLLFADQATFARASALEPYKRYGLGVCVVESKRWGRPLDREAKGPKEETGVPSTQMLRYLRRVEDLAGGNLRWGILTNGSVWRLYWQGAISVAEDFFEIDLAKTLGDEELDLIDLQSAGFTDPAAARAHVVKLFILFFGRDGFVPNHAGRGFHDLALEQGKFWEQRVARDLSDVVFDHVFEALANAIVRADRDHALEPDYLEEARQGALVLLYRLLFVLYAEDRNLLPDETGAYADFALTRLRMDVAERLSAGKTYHATMTVIWSRLAGIFQAIAKGDDALGIPPYNGGLFSGDTAPILQRVALPDAVMAEVIFRLSHEGDKKSGRGPKYINYRDLSVQQLGSVYERILEHGIRARADGTIEMAVDAAARKESGSYYTHEELVVLVIGRTVGPLVAERRALFAEQAALLAGDRRRVADRLERLHALDPASRMLDLRICDPAMGSGHFLVTLVDWLADEVLSAMAEATVLVDWADYVSPLAARVAMVRDEIARNAAVHGWPLRDGQLDDRHIVRRMILKRVVHGADKNRMAVELAKVSLWLHSFTVGAPLSFLDHHLRWGDSVVGAWTLPVLNEVHRRGALMDRDVLRKVEGAALGMRRVEESNDSDLSEVARSEQAFAEVEEETTPILGYFSLLTAQRLMGVFDAAPKKRPPAIEALEKAGKTPKQIAKAIEDTRAFERAAAFQTVLDGGFGDPVAIAAGHWPQTPVGDDRQRRLAEELVGEARDLAARHRFLHWEIAFPNVWTGLVSNTPAGGFDAVIGNPPYVRQERLGEIKAALKPLPDDPGLAPPREGAPEESWSHWRRGLARPRVGYLAFDGMADLYVYFYEQGLRLLRPGGRMGYVVTNKWLRAGYAEALRGLFQQGAWVEFAADFGHAKHFFPDADVFPSVLVVRRPDDGPPPETTEICVIPRDAVPDKGVSGAVAASAYPLPRAGFTKESWTLEPPAVMALLDKIRRNGVPLVDFAGVKPYRGVLTGFNEAFLIDTPTKERLVRDDPASAEIIKPYLRGQDIDRWVAPWAGLWMIFARRGIEIDRYPSVKRHLEQFRAQLEPKPKEWRAASADDTWSGRKEGGYAWYEIQDAIDYWDVFEGEKIMYQEIQFFPSYCRVDPGFYGNNKTFVIQSTKQGLLEVLNSPLLWWFNWRHLPHMKDEALTPMGFKMEQVPIADLGAAAADEDVVSQISTLLKTRTGADAAILDWLHHEFGLDTPGRGLATPHALDADAFVEAVKAALPRKRRLSVADLGELKREHAATVAPARAAAAEVEVLERRLSDLVNHAYGLTPEEVRLMWETAPPRMPLDPGEELRRLSF